MYGPTLPSRFTTWIAFALVLSGPVLTGTSAVLLMIPPESRMQCYPMADGSQVCGSSTGPGPLARVAGILFLAGLSIPGVGLLLLGGQAVSPTARYGFLAGGVALTIGVVAILLVLLLTPTL